ncbi:MAG: hypothetical protein KDA51_19670, partial [Planctomycetales bacterium]|nr:hypothetical protein [Planctomycetales bacterium]
SVEQIRSASDLLEQGYQPAFIERYRADETGCLPRHTLWALKLEIDRQHRQEAAKVRLTQQLPKGAELDEEAVDFLKRAQTELEIESTLRAFRARRQLQASQERDGQVGQLLEKLIGHAGSSIDDMPSWVAQQFSVDRDTALQLLEQTKRLVGTLLLCDTALNERLRISIQRKAQIRVEACEAPQGDEDDEQAADSIDESDEDATRTGAAVEQIEAVPADAASQIADQASGQAEITSAVESNAAADTEVGLENELAADRPPAKEPAAAPTESSVEAPVESADAANIGNSGETAGESETSAASQSVVADLESTEPAEAGGDAPVAESAATSSSADATTENANLEARLPDPLASFSTPAKKKRAKKGSKDKANAKSSASSRNNAKLTPRQRRRRWLLAMLHPMKSLKRQLTHLTAYQQLMLGRGRRSQLVAVHLEYDKKSIVHMARDAFVARDHALVAWFNDAVAEALEQSWRAKLENDAISELEELASEKLLVGAVDSLRQTLMQRPVRGHRILVIDTVGPKAAAIAIVDQHGKVLCTDEIPCSAQPEVVNQNVVKLGELVHKFRVTLIAITNGPARRFLIHSLRELVKQSEKSGLRWTMADRGGADAYAAGRTALKELSIYNRRDRAAIWVARSLQDPLGEYLKVGLNRLRLGSYQRELPQEPLKKLVRETMADCVAGQGIDFFHASPSQLTYVPGVDESQAQQICA